MSAPYAEKVGALSLEEKQLIKTTPGLRTDNHEINSIRKPFPLKGGRLAEMVYPARCVSLILSDVVGDNLDAIASGATVPDSTSFSDAMSIIDRYSLADKMPENVMKVIQAGFEGKIPDTPKPGSGIFSRVLNILIGTNHHALLASAEEARNLGCKTEVLTSVLTGEAREIAHFFAALGRDVCTWGDSCDLPICIISGR
jgi:hydroxypyruvate reductase